jgi:Domain of unknown function (DUF4383)
MIRTVALVYGVVFMVVGVLGFIPGITVGGEYLLGIFGVNALHNVIHLLFGVLGIAAALTGWSRPYLQGVGVVYLLLVVLGFIPGLYVGHDMLLGLVHINLADNLLHLALGGVAAYFGFSPQYGGRVAPTA